MITIAVPVLNNYRGLFRLLVSLSNGNVIPDFIYIIDNGRKLVPKSIDLPWATWIVKIITPENNLGVAASWNKIIRETGGTVIISNDDIEVYPNTIQTIVEGWEENKLCYSSGSDKNMFSLFSVGKSLFNLMGGFDEEFWPAYFEDNSAYRKISVLIKKGYSVGFKPLPYDFYHVGSATLKNYNKIETEKHHMRFKRNSYLYDCMWGGMPGEETFEQKYNGDNVYKEDILKKVKENYGY